MWAYNKLAHPGSAITSIMSQNRQRSAEFYQYWSLGYHCSSVCCCSSCPIPEPYTSHSTARRDFSIDAILSTCSGNNEKTPTPSSSPDSSSINEKHTEHFSKQPSYSTACYRVNGEFTRVPIISLINLLLINSSVLLSRFRFTDE